INRDALLQTLFPNGIPAKESVIRSVNNWLDEAERLTPYARTASGCESVRTRGRWRKSASFYPFKHETLVQPFPFEISRRPGTHEMRVPSCRPTIVCSTDSRSISRSSSWSLVEIT